MDRVRDVDAMRVLLQQRVAEDSRMLTPAGRWAVERREDGQVIGGAGLLPVPPGAEVGVGWGRPPPEGGGGCGTGRGPRAGGRGGGPGRRPGRGGKRGSGPASARIPGVAVVAGRWSGRRSPARAPSRHARERWPPEAAALPQSG